METPETQIIAACQAGNLESFVLLYDHYVEKIYRFIYYRTGHRQLAEDLTSQTFIKAMDKISSFDNESGHFQAWLYQIARNNLIDDARKRKATEPIESHYDIAGEHNIETETEKQSSYQELHALLKTLPEDAQELIRMRLWDELSYVEIAAITGKTEGSLKMQFSRIVAGLRQKAEILLVLLIVIFIR